MPPRVRGDRQRPPVRERPDAPRGGGQSSCSAVGLGALGGHRTEHRTPAENRGDWLSRDAHPRASSWFFPLTIATGPGPVFPLAPRGMSGEEGCLSCFKSRSTCLESGYFCIARPMFCETCNVQNAQHQTSLILPILAKIPVSAGRASRALVPP